MIKYQAKINLIIDALLILLLALMAGLGFVIKYVLVPGYQRNEMYGIDVELFFWGLDRHQWGSVHLWVSVVFIVLILFHVLFHWKTIKCIFRQMISGKMLRRIIVGALIFFILLFGIGPLFLKPDIRKVEKHYLFQHHSKNKRSYQYQQ